jgi:NAD(P)-dependent dehydrogenase (short-subunit alcohol dehydrogenase family)
MYYMRSKPIDGDTGSRGSVVLVASTSGYFGGTGVVSYVSSKHGVIGLLRASQKTAAQHNIRLNAVAPFFTPTYITGGYSEKWKQKGLPANTTTDVAHAILQTAADPNRTGSCCLAAGQKMTEIEQKLGAMVPEWVGPEMHNLMIEGGSFFDELGGYPLPPARK